MNWFDHDSGDAAFDRWSELQDLSKALPSVEQQRTKTPVHSARSPQPPPSSAAQRPPVSQKPVQHVFKHGADVEFRHGRVIGKGRLIGSTMTHAIVKDAQGAEHRVQHSALLPPEEGAPSIAAIRHWV